MISQGTDTNRLGNGFVFDKPHALHITQARQNFFQQWLPGLVQSAQFKTALDPGCGVGYFSRYLSGLGLKVAAFDGRSENVAEAKRRHPDIPFITCNIEDPSIQKMGSFDLILCVGLLYHLENPLLAIRHLSALTGKVLIIESMITPSQSKMAPHVCMDFITPTQPPRATAFPVRPRVFG
jgi:2-polyprenyl-3-methyl-5-hydroxy-6-metoxy-1,4-benzoquinol methylase